MWQIKQLAVLVITVVILTVAMILAVGAPSVGVVSGMIGAALPIILIYITIGANTPSPRNEPQQ